MTIGGTAVFLAGDCLCLTDTEARLLATMAARPDAVHSKERLLRAVWAGSGADTHVVETAIAPLRKRLGPYGPMIRSVHRRGYTLRA